MASTMKTLIIPCRGGLNLSNNQQELLGLPGECIRLTNFEPSKQGGYRRIFGYTKLGTAAVPSTGRIKGIRNYQGVIACRADKIYHSFDQTYWVQVNFETLGLTVSEATLIAGTPLLQTDAGRYMFAKQTVGNTEHMLIVNGKGNPTILSVTGTDRASANYRFTTITEGTALVGAQYGLIHKDQFIIGGMAADPTAIFYSSHATTDLIQPGEDDDKVIPQENFNGATAGFIGVGDIITGIKVHREILYVFCESSIVKITGLESGDAVVATVTRDIGCLDGFTIQEIGGDLLFLAPDGLRTIAGTERNNDLELGVISRKISPLLDRFIKQRERYQFDTTVIREKNQYRLWFTDLLQLDSVQDGIIGAFTHNPADNKFAWEFSQLRGLGVSAVDNSYHITKERIIHGNQAGEIHQQELGSTYDGTRINYLYQSPFVDFGDISVRKNIHKVFINTKPEGDIEIGMDLRYDLESSDVHQPATYPLEQISPAAIFGDPNVLFNDPLIKFGSRDVPDRDVYTEGSGFTVSIRISSLDIINDAPFDIQSLQIDLTIGGKI